MQGYKKQSPIRFPDSPLKTERRQGWEVALTYAGDDASLVIIDLSHITKWELYGRGLEGQQVGPAAIPHIAGQVNLSAGLAVCLCRPSVALIWQLADEFSWTLPVGVKLTEITDNYALVALIGADGPRVMEKIADLDLFLPAEQTVRFVQGPILDGASQVMILSSPDSSTGLLLAVCRGAGQSIVDAILDAGGEFGLQPAGEQVFKTWLRGQV